MLSRAKQESKLSLG